jgi:type I restriction enzyme M protein
LLCGLFNTAGAGVKTNLLFFTKGPKTEQFWYYDLTDLKVGQTTPFTIDKLSEFFDLLPTRADGPCSWSVVRDDIIAKNYDLKAVNPNRKAEEDTRTPEELLDLIEATGKEVTEAIGELRMFRFR